MRNKLLKIAIGISCAAIFSVSHADVTTCISIITIQNLLLRLSAVMVIKIVILFMHYLSNGSLSQIIFIHQIAQTVKLESTPETAMVMV